MVQISADNNIKNQNFQNKPKLGVLMSSPAMTLFMSVGASIALNTN